MAAPVVCTPGALKPGPGVTLGCSSKNLRICRASSQAFWRSCWVGVGRVVCGQCIDPGIALIDGISGLLFFQLLRRLLLLTLCHKAPDDEQGNAQSCKG